MKLYEHVKDAFEVYMEKMPILFVVCLITTMLSAVTVGLLLGPCLYGMYTAFRKAAHGEEIRVADAFVGFDNAGQQLFWDIEGSGDSRLEVFAFDRRLQTFLDGRVVGETELNPTASLIPTSRPFYLGVSESYVELSELRIYHDIYHASEAEQSGGPLPMPPVKLGPAQVYVLGDNGAVSIDSRRWGPVPWRLVVGKPVGDR